MGVSPSSLTSRSAAPVAPQGECGTGKYWLDEFKRNPSSIGNISVSEARYMKCVEGWEHEFLVFVLRDSTRREHESYVIVERQNPYGDGAPVQPPSPEGEKAIRAADNIVMYHDRVFSCNPEHIKTLLTMQFEGSVVTLEKLLVLANTVSKNTPEYHTLHSQCFWYASSIWAVLILDFGGQETRLEYAGLQGTSRLLPNVNVKLGHGPGVAPERAPQQIRVEYREAWKEFEREIKRSRRKLQEKKDAQMTAIVRPLIQPILEEANASKVRASHAEARASALEKELKELKASQARSQESRRYR
ncbi:hypothetical protein C8J56DRAFT_932738 [Mycena floridula]|nr:hypothetical protein C8J56DRAFT_932738 [Mycena floridula]